MKKEFSKHWEASKQPRKQRKYRANAPLNIRKKFVSVNLSKDLRKNENKRNVIVKKDDVVKIMTGKFKGKQGKVLKVLLKISKILVEGISIKKRDGSKTEIKMQPSNLQIITLADRKKSVKNNSPETSKKENAQDKNKEIKK